MVQEKIPGCIPLETSYHNTLQDKLRAAGAIALVGLHYLMGGRLEPQVSTLRYPRTDLMVKELKHIPSYNESASFYDQSQELADAMQGAEEPLLIESGWFAVPNDYTNDDGKQTDHRYTEAFANRNILVDRLGLPRAVHDAGHAIALRQLLQGNPWYADALQMGATLALGDPELEKEFVAIADGAGDAMTAALSVDNTEIAERSRARALQTDYPEALQGFIDRLQNLDQAT